MFESCRPDHFFQCFCWLLMPGLPTVSTLQQQLKHGQTTSENLTRQALDRIQDAAGQGRYAFTRIFADRALALARLSDAGRRAGQIRSPIEGLPISVKDVFDVCGAVTTAGSQVLAKRPAAKQHAVLVQRLLDAGGILVGQTTMTEFAFSGLGLNPYYGSPSSPWDRRIGRVAGGSSSGAGVAVADGMSVIALGTDTGGSLRIPAAFCGITGFKPTARRLPTQGTIPLSTSLDSAGPLGNSVACCALADAILSGNPACTPPAAPSLHGLRFAVPASVVFDQADDTVLQTFEEALGTLRAAGAVIQTLPIPEFEQYAYINRHGGLAVAEAWHWHQKLATAHADAYDPRVLTRLLVGRDMSASDYIDVLQARRHWITSVETRLHGHDALLMPTVPIVPPAMAELEACDDAYFPADMLVLRNPSLINFLDGCALSIPCHPRQHPPVGLTVAGPSMHDTRILAIGQAIERALQT